MDFKELDKFLKICRKHGITEIECEGVKAKFGDAPPKKDWIEQEEEVEVESLTPEQLMFYHTNGGTA